MLLLHTTYQLLRHFSLHCDEYKTFNHFIFSLQYHNTTSLALLIMGKKIQIQMVKSITIMRDS